MSRIMRHCLDNPQLACQIEFSKRSIVLTAAAARSSLVSNVLLGKILLTSPSASEVNPETDWKILVREYCSIAHAVLSTQPALGYIILL